MSGANSEVGGVGAEGGQPDGDAGAPFEPGSGGALPCNPAPGGGRVGVGGTTCTCGGQGNGVIVGTDACPDLDGNEIADCNETAVRNAAFNEDTRDWSAEAGLILSWTEDDARKVSDSGALVVENTYRADREGQFMTGARQCLDIPEPAVYRAAAEIAVPEGQEGSGGMQMLFFDDVGCTGDVVTSGLSETIPAGRDWQIIQLSRTAPPGIKSLALRLIAIKPYRPESFKVLFDNVLVRRD